MIIWKILPVFLLISISLPFSARGENPLEALDYALGYTGAPVEARIPRRAEGRTAVIGISFLRPAAQSGSLLKLRLVAKPGIQAVNAVRASLRYDPDLLQMILIDNTESDFSLFLTGDEHGAGQIIIEALQPYPGFAKDARIADVLFLAKAKGSGRVELSGDSLALANDGFGTDVILWEESRPAEFRIR